MIVTADLQTRIARILRIARGCESASTVDDDTVPCSFCFWDAEDGMPHDETGCYWFADQIIAAINAPPDARGQ